jgi:hypothetical protein
VRPTRKDGILANPSTTLLYGAEIDCISAQGNYLEVWMDIIFLLRYKYCLLFRLKLNTKILVMAKDLPAKVLINNGIKRNYLILI